MTDDIMHYMHILTLNTDYGKAFIFQKVKMKAKIEKWRENDF